MMTTTNDDLTIDLTTGTVRRVLGVMTIDGVAGWAKVEFNDGTIWAYAPQNYYLTNGEIARQLS